MEMTMEMIKMEIMTTKSKCCYHQYILVDANEDDEDRDGDDDIPHICHIVHM